MRSTRIAILALVVVLVAAVAVPGAIACDKTKAAKAETASTTTAQAKNCDPANCDPAACADKASAVTASTTTASTCTKSAAASATTVAGTSCSKTAAAQTANAGCSSKASAAAKYDIAVETAKLPSGALAVMYRGQDADTVAMLHSAANGSVEEFGCQNVQKMAQAENCKVEMATIDDGLIFLCTSDDAQLIAGFQKDYELAQATPTQEEPGE